ncbi:uncharacterized protein LOC130980595 [Arachis stenosperma]|uniref:uncharacterized protein LOC130980595 n=1 Tax=Arachis stenosperma TaxID=217475 RepID=UPI0025AD5601|nr:uncharacterized protein LOC130980595 [Arachis stenosperma]
MGFGQRWKSWIMECVSMSSMSVLINGLPSKPFKIERGLRQRDPLSPFLFVLVTDDLHRMFGKAARNGRISPLLVDRDHVELSHLQFANDTVLFCPPEEETIKNYKRLLRCFELMSGLIINFDNSSLIPINCDVQWVQHMSRVLGCKVASLPVKYLGIQLGVNPRLVRTWKPIIDKVEQKQSILEAKVLNKASKLVLIKSVLNSLLVYYLSLYKMQKAVAEKLISLQRRCYLHGGPWKDICQLQFKDQQVRQKIINGLSMEIGDGRGTRFREDVWLRGGTQKDLFPRLFSVLNQRGSVIGDCGFWDGLEWKWNFQWRRQLFQWELDLVNQLYETLRLVETLPEDIASYSFTRIVWKGLVPPRVELFIWFDVHGCLLLEGYGRARER